MTTNLKPYPTYKPSGIEWLGDVPAHWEVRRLKLSVENVADQTHKRRKREIYLAMEHVESWTGRYRDAGSDVNFDSQVKRFRVGDVLFGKLRPYLAKVTRPNRAGVCVGEFLVLRPRDCAMSPGYLEQLMRSKPIIDAINASTFGAKMPRADWQFIGDMVQPLPPLPEQTAIVRYLDHMDRAHSRYISSRERLIELLEEQRQAVIHQAVTRGLDPDARLKPSGVEWLGDVPAGWEISLIKRSCQVTLGQMLKSNQTSLDETEEPYLRAANIHWRGVDTTDVKRMWFTAAEKKKLKLRKGDLLVCEGGDVGRGTLWNDEMEACYIQNSVHRIRARKDADTRFLYYWLYFIKHVGYIDMICNKATIAHFTVEKVEATPCVYPSLEEQKQIAAFLDKVTADIDTAINRAHREIALLSEYRTRLIADVVTGQVDVREAAAQLPDEAGADKVSEKVRT